MIKKDLRRLKRKKSLRKKIVGSSDRPRLTVFRSNKFVYAQIIDDSKSVTLASASDRGSKGTNVEKAISTGKSLAELALKKKVSTVVFDRNGYKYHGRVKALADSAREAGLVF